MHYNVGGRVDAVGLGVGVGVGVDCVSIMSSTIERCEVRRRSAVRRGEELPAFAGR